MTDRIQAPRSEGIGLVLPLPRNPAHAETNWFQLDTDDEFEDPDVEPADPLPTERHRSVPTDLS